MKNYKEHKIKFLLYSLFVPILIYFSLTVITVLVLNGTKFNNGIFMTGIAAILSIPVLSFVFSKISKDREDNIESFEFKKAIYLIPFGVSINWIFNTLLILLNILPNDEMALKVNEEINNLNIFLALFFAVFVVPDIEEIMSRGFIFKSVEKISNFYIAAIGSGLCFALLHGNLSQGIFAFFAGIFLSYVYYKFDNIIYSYFLHAVINFSSFTLFYDHENIRNMLFVMFVGIILFLTTLYRIELLNDKRILIKKKV